MKPEYEIDYAAGLRSLQGEPIEKLIAVIRDELPEAWIARYHRMCDGPTNVLEVPLRSFSYLFDFAPT